MAGLNHVILFSIDDRRFALPLSNVERIVRAVEITPLPKAPDVVLGVINVQGRIIPVINIRKRFGLHEREIDPGDQLVIARTSNRSIAFVADSVSGAVEIPENDVVEPADILPGIEYVKGIVKNDEGIIHILDLDPILSFGEVKSLDNCLEETTGGTI